MFTVSFHPASNTKPSSLTRLLIRSLHELLDNPKAFQLRPVTHTTETLVGHVSYTREGTEINVPVMVCAEAADGKLVPYSFTEVIEDIHRRFVACLGGDVTSVKLECTQGETSTALEEILTEVFRSASFTTQPSPELLAKGQVLLDLSEPVAFSVTIVGLNKRRWSIEKFRYEDGKFTVGSLLWTRTLSGHVSIRQLWATVAMMKSYRL